MHTSEWGCAPHVHANDGLFTPGLAFIAPATLTFRQMTPSSGGKLPFFCFGEKKPCGSSSLLIQISKGGPDVCLQAKRAVQRGATAVIFDVSENPDAIDQVCAHPETICMLSLQQHGL